MTNVNEFMEEFLQHEYDPEKRCQYYLRTRKLKGRRRATTARTPGQVPTMSPTGAKLVDYKGAGNGSATYADGSSYTSAGWGAKRRRGGNA